MPPTDLLKKLKSMYYDEEKKEVLPAMSTPTAVGILVLYTVVYVAPFYLSSTTRPSQQLSRDSPSSIKGRIHSVTFSCIVCALATFGILWNNNETPAQALHSMGFYPVGIIEAMKSTGLTFVLFLGPLFEAGVAEGSWKHWIRLRGVKETLGSWIGYRNLVAGPVTEEILFRSCAIPLFLLAHATPKVIIFGTPLIFGLAHIHHFYEFRITHPHTPLPSALARSFFQLSYTTLFGAYATFVYLRTASLLAVILAHAFCNYMGLPRVWGRLDGVPDSLLEPDTLPGGNKRDEDGGGAKSTPRAGRLSTSRRLGASWTVAYYVLLVAGAYGFYKYLWTLTASQSALIPL